MIDNANQAGDDNYLARQVRSADIRVSPASQAITVQDS